MNRLRLYGPGGMDHVDPCCAYHPPAGQLLRLFTRQLFSYPAEADLRDWRAVTPVPDLAADVPTIYNAGMGASGRTYTVHMRPGVYWDTTPPRAVTTHDVVRGFKRMCNPVRRSPVLSYFTSTIRGMAEYCASFASPGGDRDAAELAGFQNAHDIPGVRAVDDETIVFELNRPTLDFINMLALTCASPAPVEYDAYLPDSPELRENLRSVGPYRFDVPSLSFSPNPAWRQETDPVRGRPVERIEVTVTPATPEQVAEKIQAGGADLAWGPVASSGPPAGDLGLALDPYLLLNLRGVLSTVELRRAVSYAVDKSVLLDLFPEGAARVAGSVVPPGNDAHVPSLDPYATAGGRGNRRKARTLLAAAGVEDPVLTLVHPAAGAGAAVAGSVAADLTRTGITVRIIGLDPAAFHRTLTDLPGEWDIAVASRWPDWYDLNARVFLQPLVSAGNVAGYSCVDVDDLVQQAVETVEPVKANLLWQDVQRRVLDDTVVVPLLFRAPVSTPVRGSRVRDAVPLPTFGYVDDLTALRLVES